MNSHHMFLPKNLSRPNFTSEIIIEVIPINIQDSCANGDINKSKSNVCSAFAFEMYIPKLKCLIEGK